MRVLIADDHPPTRAGVRMALEANGFEVCAEVGDAGSAIEAARRELPDVCLLDIHMPGDGIHAAEAISRELPETAVVMLTVSRTDSDLFDALRAGASGYLTKDHSPEELTEAIRRVYRGNKYVSPGLAERLAADLAAGSRDIRHELLSDREYEVLCLLGSGRTVKEIAHSLELSPKTVSTYRTRVLEKMGASSNADLVRYAALHGLIS
jgi:two-component system invasion response regulator UvrY